MLKPGYKQTDLGVLPEEWGVAKLADLTFKIGSGITPTGGNKVYQTSGRPFVRSQNVGWGSLLLDDISYISEETHSSFAATELKDKDVLLNITGASIGRSAIADKRITGGNVNQHVCIIRTDPKLLNSGYLCSFLLSFSGQNLIDSFQTGGNRQGLNFEQIKSFQLPIPPLAEQQAIAKTLGALDALLTSQQQLLAKKRALKLATQQALLSGERRLPGFAEESEFETLGELILNKPAKAALEGRNELVSFIGMEDVSEHGQLLASHQLPIQEVNKGLTYFERDDVLVAKITPCFENGKGAHVDALKTRKGFGSTEFHVLRANNNAIAKYIFYHTQSGDFRKKLEGEMIGTAGQKRVPIAAILNYNLPFGHSKAEQRAIAAILSDMDAEIEALAAQVAKTQALKQGMMQDLLTGTIRLRAGAAAPSSHPTL